MCVFFISLPLYAQPSELFLKGQPLNIQSVVEFMVSSEWFNLQEVGCGYVDWIRLAQDRDRWRTLVSAVMNLPFPYKCGEFLD